MSGSRIAVLGHWDSVLVFQALGLPVFPIQSVEQARSMLHRLVEENYAVICLTEKLAGDLERDIVRYQHAPTPAILLIPGREGPLGVGMGELRGAVERAVGVDILE
ncbi:MAG TPA: V-type ATP synthase subunit F [Candidatus Enterenecus stercoripullorum]|nr:V-type ATP synthase subunit F [Candidatus Enterenecus stercoripullorum]